MVRIVDGNTEQGVLVWIKKGIKQIKLPILLYTCAPISELPSNISTMVYELLRCDCSLFGIKLFLSPLHYLEAANLSMI